MEIAVVCVRPPLFCSGPRRGSGDIVPTQVPSVSMYPPSLNRLPAKLAQFGAPMLFATMVFRRVSGPKLAIPPAPYTYPVLLPENVLLVTVSGLKLAMPPPELMLLLPENVLLVTVSVPPLEMPPPTAPLLPENVLLLTLSVPPPKLLMPPPAFNEPLFPENVLLVTVSIPRLRMPPPPWLALLPENVL